MFFAFIDNLDFIDFGNLFTKIVRVPKKIAKKK